MLLIFLPSCFKAIQGTGRHGRLLLIRPTQSPPSSQHQAHIPASMQSTSSFQRQQVEPSTANVRPAARPRSQMIREVLDAERLFEHRAVQYTDGDEAQTCVARHECEGIVRKAPLRERGERHIQRGGGRVENDVNRAIRLRARCNRRRHARFRQHEVLGRCEEDLVERGRAAPSSDSAHATAASGRVVPRECAASSSSEQRCAPSQYG